MTVLAAFADLAESRVYKVINAYFGGDFKLQSGSAAYDTGGLVVNPCSLLLRSGRVAADSSVPRPAARVPFLLAMNNPFQNYALRIQSSLLPQR